MGTRIYMHEVLWCHMHGMDDIPEGYYVSHRNGDGLDNRRDNLALERGERPGPCGAYASSDGGADASEAKPC